MTRKFRRSRPTLATGSALLLGTVFALAGTTKSKPSTKKQSAAKSGAYAKKIVPIISVGQGIHLGAAQVVGPPAQVNKVKAVAQVEADFKRAAGARIRALIPVSTENVISKLARVDQVAVAMYGDVDPRKVF